MQVDLSSALDIGAGNGKYGRMIHQHHPECFVTGLEIEETYVPRFNLHHIYDDVTITDAMTLLRNPDQAWDFIMLGDVIEHLKKSDGIDLLNFLVYRAKWIMVIYPERMLQDSWEGHAAEAHISTWRGPDFAAFDATFIPKDHKMVVIIDGYRAHDSEIARGIEEGTWDDTTISNGNNHS